MPTKSHEQVIQSFINVHGDRYDYSLVEYTKSSDKVIIVCKKHGEFHIQPYRHAKGYGCYRCNKNNKYNYTKEDFVERALKIHGDTYDYSELVYINSSTKVIIICKEHGQFEQVPTNHLNGRGCRLCANNKIAEARKIYTTESFIEKSNKRHNNKYEYLFTEYLDFLEAVTVTCKIHGNFKQKPNEHLRGSGCPACANENRGYSRSKYIKNAKDRVCTFYIIRCYDENEEFYKIGITLTSLKKRYNTTKKMPYNYEIIYQVFGSAEYIWNLELNNKRTLKEFNYQPQIKFKGSKTECFENIESLNILINKT